jgi:hypothetical protein
MSKDPKNPTDALTIDDQASAPGRPVPLRRWSVADLIARAFAVDALENRSAPAFQGR